ncbi:transposase [Streptomyces sp. NPDC085466]|uniref:IS110 family transposase n=1 Tax=Streptomyces sp. NPDC085466 TaxID=3365725 RepID=UPI0037D0A2B0
MKSSPGSTLTPTHHAAVVDPLGRPVADQEFPATTQGYRPLLAWLGTFGQVQAVGVECTGSCGAGLTTALTASGLVVVEVDVPDRVTRHSRGKSDPTRSTLAWQPGQRPRAEPRPFPNPHRHSGGPAPTSSDPCFRDQGQDVSDQPTHRLASHRS